MSRPLSSHTPLLLSALLLAACTDDTAGCDDTTLCDDASEDGASGSAPPVELARPPAPAEGSVCAGNPPGVVTIERPMFPESAGSGSFGYSFRRFAGTDPNAPTIIFLPGGPGGTSIDTERPGPLATPTYSVIMTDPRGVGCNAPERSDYYPDQFYSSVNFADDVIAIIEDQQLDNYIVYGISYGTLLGTILASRIEERGLPPPRAVVLEGVIGEAFTPDTPADYLGFQERWRDVRDRLDPSIRDQLTADPLPGGLTGEQWGAAIAAALPRGASPISGGEDYMYALLSIYLSPAATAEQRAELPAIIEEMGASPVDDMGLRLHTEVTCREITETEYVSIALEDGELVPVEFDCEDVALSDAFSAADWPVHAPIYYFSGSEDPSTPPWQARSHFDAQTSAPRQLVHVLGASHNPLVLNLSDCAEAVWRAMATGTGFEAAVAGCQWPVELE